MFVLEISLITVMLFTLFFSYKKYNNYIKQANKKQHPLRILYPCILAISDFLINIGILNYNQTVKSNIVFINGVKNYYLQTRLHYAAKLTYMMIIILVFIPLVESFKFDFSIIAAFIFIEISIYLVPDIKLQNFVRENKRSIEEDFFTFLTRLTLLLNAGLMLKTAIQKSIPNQIECKTLYNGKKSSTSVFYRNIKAMILDINNGVSEAEAFMEFANKCRVQEITKFTSIIIQNLRKGGSELSLTLLNLSNEILEKKKRDAKKLGEEANSKLVLPLMLMLISVIIITIAPIFFQLRMF